MCDDHHHHHDHDHHSHDAEDNSAQFSLYMKIDTDGLRCLNEADDDSGKTIFKPWDERFNQEKYVESDVDAELLFNIPFTGVVKLKSVCVIGGESASYPTEMRLFKNMPDMTFDNTEKVADQVLSFPSPGDELVALKFPTKATKFSNLTHLSIYFPENGHECTKLYYIGLAGDFMQAQRQPVVVTNYELRANPADHRTKLFDPAGHMIS